MLYKENEIIIFEKGEYSDRYSKGVFVCTKDFDLQKEVDIWKIENTIDYSGENEPCVIVRGIEFIDYLIFKSLIKGIKVSIVNQNNIVGTLFLEDKIDIYQESSEIIKPYEYN